MDLKDITITVDDVRKCNMCAHGMKDWFEQVGLGDRFREFVRQGLPAQVIWDTGDGYAHRVVTSKIEREKVDG